MLRRKRPGSNVAIAPVAVSQTRRIVSPRRNNIFNINQLSYFDRVEVTVVVPVPERVKVPDAEPVLVRVDVRERVPVAEPVAERVDVRVRVPDDEPVPVRVGVRDKVAVAEPVAERVDVRDTVPVTEPVRERVDVNDLVDARDAENVAENRGVQVAVGVQHDLDNHSRSYN